MIATSSATVIARSPSPMIKSINPDEKRVGSQRKKFQIKQAIPCGCNKYIFPA
jgi:hypothetical protein